MQIFTLLLAHGADTNAVDQGGWTPLHVAAQNGYVRAVEVLIGKGAELNARTTGYSGYLSWVTGGQTPFLLALREGHLNVAELLVDHGADINMPDDSGQTPLSCVLYEVCYDVGPLRHADYRGLQGQDAIAVHDGLQKAYRKWIDRFLAHGADVNPKDKGGGTPLHNAARASHEALAKLLIAHGATIDAKDNDGVTPLHEAARVSKGMTELLLAHGAAVDIADNRGDTPLHKAVLSGRHEIVGVLLAHHADVSLRNRRGSTPLDEARRRRYTEMVQLLTAKAGAQDGRTRK